MASKYLQKFPVPNGFEKILHDFCLEILRAQPEDLIEYSYKYFEYKAKGEDYVYEGLYNVKKSEQKSEKQYVKEPMQQFDPNASNSQHSDVQLSRFSDKQEQLDKEAANQPIIETEQQQKSNEKIDDKESEVSREEHTQKSEQSEKSEKRLQTSGSIGSQSIKEAGKEYLNDLYDSSIKNYLDDSEIQKSPDQLLPPYTQQIDKTPSEQKYQGRIKLNLIQCSKLLLEEDDLEVYCVAFLSSEPDKIIKTNISKGRDPQFNTSDQFFINLTSEDILETHLIIQVFCYEGTKELIGELQLDLYNSFLNSKWINDVYKIKNISTNEEKGEVYFQLIFIPDGAEEQPDPINIFQQQQDENDTNIQGELEIKIQGCEQLKLIEENQDADEDFIFYVVSFLSTQPENFIKSQNFTGKTNPEWNFVDKFFINFTEEQLLDTHIIFQLYNISGQKELIGEANYELYNHVKNKLQEEKQFELQNSLRQSEGFINTQINWLGTASVQEL